MSWKFILGQEVRRNLEEFRDAGGGGSLGWSLDGVYIHKCLLKNTFLCGHLRILDWLGPSLGFVREATHTNLNQQQR